jgi:preprotein translocase subunit SecG
MSFFAGILIFVMIVNCALLTLLVLMQLPKKDAGAGLAFGGGAADALFGAGSGNFLTQATKYSVITFCLLALFLGHLENKLHNDTSATDFMKAVQQKQQSGASMAPPVTAPANTPPAAAAPVNSPLSLPMTVAPGTSAPATTTPAK